MHSKIFIFKLVGLVSAALFSLWFGFLSQDSKGAMQWIMRYEYWVLLFSTIFVSCAAIRFILERDLFLRIRANWRACCLPACFIAIVSSCLWWAQPCEFKIVMDEPVLIDTAMHMHESQSSKIATKGYEINGNFYLGPGYVGKRPTFYAFVISMFHSLTGYRASQGFVLNAILTPIFLFGLFYLGQLLWKAWGGYLAVGLFATVPLLAMSMNSSSFELLNLTLLTFSILFAYGHIRRPTDTSLNLLLWSVVILAHTRYESALFVGAAAIVILMVWFERRKVSLTWSACLAPLALISIPLRRIVHHDNDILWQLDYRDAVTPFSLEFIPKNLARAANYFFAMNVEQANSILLSILFVAALVLMLWLFASRTIRLELKSPVLLSCAAFSLIVLINFGILMAYFWGQIDDAMATRIALPFLLLQVLLVVAIGSHWQARAKFGPVLFIGILLFFFSVSRPLMARSNFLMRSYMQQEVEWFDTYSKTRDGENVLYISNRHMVTLIQRKSSLYVTAAVHAKLKLDLHLKLKTFDDIVLVEFRPYKISGFAKEIAAMEEAEMNFQTETLRQEKLNDYGEIRVARVVGVKMDDALRNRAEAESAVLFTGESDFKDFFRTLP